MWRKQTEKDFKKYIKTSCNFEENFRSNCTPLYSRLKKQYIFKVKLNDNWTNQYKKLSPMT